MSIRLQHEADETVVQRIEAGNILGIFNGTTILRNTVIKIPLPAEFRDAAMLFCVT